MGGATSSDQRKKAPVKECLLSLENGCVIDNYHIKLTPVQMANLFSDLMSAKKTLTWKIMIREKQITFRKCLEQKIDVGKLYNMQPDIDEWIAHGKVELQDCKDMGLWRPNPFYHFHCHIGDLIVHRQSLPPEILIQGGVKFNILLERYGLTPELMVLLRYSPEDWVRLGLTEIFLGNFNDRQWKEIFLNLTKEEVIAAIRYFKSQTMS